MTAPACANPKCGQPLRKRTGKGKSGYRGRDGWCGPCASRWNAAGQPPSGPPDPTPRAERGKASREQERAGKEARIAEFAALRAGGLTIPEAAARTGVSACTGAKYEAEIRRRQRQGVKASMARIGSLPDEDDDVPPDPSEQCRGRVRYPALDGAQMAAKVLRGIGRPVGDPKKCGTCSGFHLPAQKQQRARGRAA